MAELVTLTRDGEIGIITVNNPPVNALSPGVPQGIAQSIDEIANDASLKAGVLIGEGQTFIAGADIKEFGKLFSGTANRDAAGLNPTLYKIEDCPKPIICAIHGTAFGGGLEFAMACHYRVAVPSAQVGQPEVKLGIIPGAAGTQRLPRLAGVMKAVEMCAKGDPIKAAEAVKLGILDKLVEGDLLQGALAFAREKVAEGKPPRKTRELTDKLGDEKSNSMVFAMARQMAQKEAPGFMAPLKAIDAVEAATKLPFDEGVKAEQRLFIECMIHPQARALIHVFFAQRATSKIPGISKDVKPRVIKKAAVIGAGTMGGGIAMAYVNAGIPVVIKEVKQEFLDRGLDTIKKNYESTVKKGKMTPEKMSERVGMLTPTLSYDDFKDVDLVIEAAFENMDIKREIFSQLEKVCKPDAILATNTSTLDIDKMAEMTSRPQQVIGHHFFSPANVMPLLEVVRGKQTSDEVIVTSMSLAKQLKKTPVLVGNCFGFVGNRMIGQYTREAQFLLEEGASVEQVDNALMKLGMKMGPFAMSDLAGVDVGYLVKQGAKHVLKQGLRESKITDKLYELKRWGQKTGMGFYKYESGNRKPVADPEVEKIVEETAKEAGIERRKITDEEIVERTVYALINEGAKILEEGYALRASDIDIIYIFGYGFPAFLGGPMWYADQVGVKKIYAKVCEFEKQHGEYWTPAPLLKKLAEESKTFASLDSAKT